MMLTKVQKWGNSQGLRLARNVLDLADIAVGDEVEIIVGEHEIVLRKVRASTRFDLAELVARIPADYDADEVDIGPPVGREAW
jgi:antitoxin MazE